MLKPIKFDLKLSNGETLCTLDDLKNNLTIELFEHFHSGKLAKWLQVRKLEQQANVVENLLAEINDREVQSFKGLIELFGGKTDDADSLQTAIAERKKMLPSSVQHSDDEEIARLKEELSKKDELEYELKTENATLNAEIEKYKSEIDELKLSGGKKSKCTKCKGFGKVWDYKNGGYEAENCPDCTPTVKQND